MAAHSTIPVGPAAPATASNAMVRDNLVPPDPVRTCHRPPHADPQMPHGGSWSTRIGGAAQAARLRQTYAKVRASPATRPHRPPIERLLIEGFFEIVRHELTLHLASPPITNRHGECHDSHRPDRWMESIKVKSWVMTESGVVRAGRLSFTTRLMQSGSPGRGPLPDGADANGHPGRPGVPARGRHPGPRGLLLGPGRGQRGAGGVAHDDPGEPGSGQAADWRGEDEADAGGVRRLPAARRTDVYPQDKRKRVALVVGNAPRHQGNPIDEALADNPHLEFNRRPSDSPTSTPSSTSGSFAGGVRPRTVPSRACRTRSGRSGPACATPRRSKAGFAARSPGCYARPDDRTASAGS